MTDKEKEKIKRIENYARSINNRAQQVQIAQPDVHTENNLEKIVEFSEQIEEIAKTFNE
jgi:hypothetical protein